MDFFDKLGKKASQTYKYTTEKTSKMAKEAKIKMSMNESKSKIDELYKEIGKKYYEQRIAKDEVEEDFTLSIEEICKNIDELCEKIENERKEILSLKDKKQCPKCFCEMEAEAQFCPTCGFKQDGTEINQDENTDTKLELEKENKNETEQDTTDATNNNIIN